MASSRARSRGASPSQFTAESDAPRCTRNLPKQTAATSQVSRCTGATAWRRGSGGRPKDAASRGRVQLQTAARANGNLRLIAQRRRCEGAEAGLHPLCNVGVSTGSRHVQRRPALAVSLVHAGLTLHQEGHHLHAAIDAGLEDGETETNRQLSPSTHVWSRPDPERAADGAAAGRREARPGGGR